MRSARTRPCASERKTSRASTADLPEPGPPVTTRVLLTLLASEDAGWLSQSTSSAKCPEKGHAGGTRSARHGGLPPRWEGLETLRLTGAGRPLIGSRDVGMRSVRDGVRGQAGVARCGQDWGQMDRRSLGGDLWVMSEHAAVFPRSTRLAGVPGDQSGATISSQCLALSPAVWR